MSAPLCFLDTETTGVHPEREVWEVAMIRSDEHGVRETQFFVDVDLAKADPFGLNIGGFYQRHPYGRFLACDPTATLEHHGWAEANYSGASYSGERTFNPEAAATQVARWTHGAHIVGAVPSFDTEVLGALLRRHGLTPSWHYHLIDVENLAVGYMAAECFHTGQSKAGMAPPWDSRQLAESLGVQISDEDRHTALGDARWAMRLYGAVMS